MTDPVAANDDAVEVLRVENEMIASLLADWREATDSLAEADDVDTRWDRGSAAKLLVQHVAARESAKDLLASGLEQSGATGLAASVRGDDRARKEALSRLDELGRGHQAITLSNPEMNQAVETFAELFDHEAPGEDAEFLRAVRSTLDRADGDIPSAKDAYAESTLDPNLEPAWYDRFTVLRRLRARYQHVRFSPRGGTKPGVDPARESTRTND